MNLKPWIVSVFLQYKEISSQLYMFSEYKNWPPDFVKYNKDLEKEIFLNSMLSSKFYSINDIENISRIFSGVFVYLTKKQKKIYKF